MANILITPAAANKPEELQSGVGTGPYVVAEADRGAGNYSSRVNPELLGPEADRRADPGPLPARGVRPGRLAAQR